MTGAGWLYEAFIELSTTRTYTFGGAAMIPIDKVWMWKDRFGGPEWFPDAIGKIDSEWLASANR